MRVTATRYFPEGWPRVIVSFYGEGEPSTLFLDVETWELLKSALAVSPHFEVIDDQAPDGGRIGEPDGR